jgi:RNA polymerase sigma-70 factor (ECF subfamily)
MHAAAQTAGTFGGTFPRTAGPYTEANAQPTTAQGRNLGAENVTAGSAQPVTATVEWVRRAQKGDVAAFEKLFEQYQRGIYNLVFQMVRSDADAADLTQDVFIRAWKSLPRLEAPEAFGSWLYRIGGNLARNWIRDNTRVRQESLDQPIGDDDEGGGREIPDYTYDPSASTQTKAVQETVHRAIAGLSEDHRMVVTLHHINGKSVEEIAEIMRCSVGTVKSRLSRARDHLRRKLSGLVEV